MDQDRSTSVVGAAGRVEQYEELGRLAQRLYCLHLQIVASALREAGVSHVSPGQALFLYDIAETGMVKHTRISLTPGRVTHTLRKLRTVGAVRTGASRADLRKLVVVLTPEGQRIRSVVDRCLREHARRVPGDVVAGMAAARGLVATIESLH